MNFNDYKYERINLEEIQNKFKSFITEFNNSKNIEEQIVAFDKIIELRNHIDTMTTLVSIRHSIDTTNEFYDKENDYLDEISPIITGFISNFYKALISSTFRNELEEKYGKLLFQFAELSIKTFDEKIIPDLQEENKLVSQYDKLRANAKILFDGEEKTLSEMSAYSESKDRNIRLESTKKVAEFYKNNIDEFDQIYDGLVKVRTKIAKKLGYENYIQLAYDRLSRTDYNAKDVANYRKQVLENIVPLYTELRKRQEKRLGLDKLKFYDENINFNS